MKLFPGFALGFLFGKDIEIIIHLIIFLAEGYVAQGEVIPDFHIGITLDGFASAAVQTGGIAVNLVFVHNVHTGGTGCLTAGALIKREVLILSNGRNRSRNCVPPPRFWPFPPWP